jgi:hypothetical protein
VGAAPWFRRTVRGNGSIRREVRTPGHFTGVELSLPAQVELRAGSDEGVSIETDHNLLAFVETVVEDGSLKLRAAKERQLAPTRLKFIVTLRELSKVAVGGSGRVSGTAPAARQLKLEIGGTGTIALRNVHAGEVAAEIGGHGDMRIDGTARRLKVSIGGSGRLRAPRFKADEVSVSLAGSGSATVWAVEALRVSIAGSGDVDYRGEPRVTSHIAGSGRLGRIGPDSK